MTDAGGIQIAGEVARYLRYRRDHVVEIGRFAMVRNLDLELTAAAMFALAERRMEREETCAPAEVVVGLGRTIVAGGCSCNISTQHFYQAERLKVVRIEVASEVAEHFHLTDLKIGKNSQFTSYGSIPASLLRPDGRGYLRLDADPWLGSMFLTLSVTNVDAEHAHPFEGIVVCRRYWGWEGMRQPGVSSGER